MPERERVTRLPTDREPDTVKIARVEEVVGGIREDVSDIKADLKTFKESFEHRLSYVEDVRLRGLEDREIARKAVADERARATDAAQAAAEQAAATATEQNKQKLSTRQFWIGTALICIATLLGALIASGHV